MRLYNVEQNDNDLERKALALGWWNWSSVRIASIQK
jgi:hypothetical protein